MDLTKWEKGFSFKGLWQGRACHLPLYLSRIPADNDESSSLSRHRKGFHSSYRRGLSLRCAFYVVPLSKEGDPERAFLRSLEAT